MKRKLFFFLEKLEIKRSERIAISALLILLVLSSSLWILQQPSFNYDAEHYRELKKVFKEKSEIRRQERELILARYEPNRELAVFNSAVEEPEPEIVEQDTIENREQSLQESLVNINEATVEQLQELPGIGPAYARRIIEWREKNDAFTSKDQLLEIKGIGEKRLANIKPRITI